MCAAGRGRWANVLRAGLLTAALAAAVPAGAAQAGATQIEATQAEATQAEATQAEATQAGATQAETAHAEAPPAVAGAVSAGGTESRRFAAFLESVYQRTLAASPQLATEFGSKAGDDRWDDTSEAALAAGAARVRADIRAVKTRFDY